MTKGTLSFLISAYRKVTKRLPLILSILAVGYPLFLISLFLREEIVNSPVYYYYYSPTQDALIREEKKIRTFFTPKEDLLENFFFEYEVGPYHYEYKNVFINQISTRRVALLRGTLFVDFFPLFITGIGDREHEERLITSILKTLKYNRDQGDKQIKKILKNVKDVCFYFDGYSFQSVRGAFNYRAPLPLDGVSTDEASSPPPSLK